MRIERRVDWEERLLRFIESRRRAAFCWGKNDCCLFAAEAVREMTGRDLAARWRGRYASAAGARRMGKIDRLVNSIGLPTLPNVKFARRGDVLLLKIDKRQSLGVCVGNVVAVPGTDALQFVTLDCAISGWRV